MENICRPLISIIVPTYNVSDYIEECLDSICHQSLQDFEIICVEDCSTDNTFSVLTNCAKKDSRITVIRHSENKGLSAARNTGIDAATGKYILYVDSDDYLVDGALQRMSAVIQEHNLDLLIFCREQFQISPSSELSILPTKYRTASINCVMTGAKLMDLQIRQGEFNPVVWTQLVDADFLKKSGIHFYDGIRHEDELYTPLIMGKACRTMCIEDKLVMHRMHNASIMGSGVSYKTIVGYFVGYCELMSRYIAGGCQVSGLEARAKTLYSSAFSKFQMLCADQQELVRRELPEAYRFLFEKSNMLYTKQLAEQKSKLEENDILLSQQRKQLDYLQSQNAALQKDLFSIRNSLSFKIAKSIMYIPRKVLRLFRTI